MSKESNFNSTIEKNYRTIENDIQKAFPDFGLCKGFSSGIIVYSVRRMRGKDIDILKKNIQSAAENEIKNLIIQPTNIIHGVEYNNLQAVVDEYSNKFNKLKLGNPLLTSKEDFKKVERAITNWTYEYDDGKSAIIFVGHGGKANLEYKNLQSTLNSEGFENYYIGTIAAEPTPEDIIEKFKSKKYKRIILEPLMLVSGTHACRDIFGENENSWKSKFKKAGYEVICLIRGLAENPDIRKIYVEHAKEANEN